MISNIKIKTEDSLLKKTPDKFISYQNKQIDRIEFISQLPESIRFEMKVVSSVFPFRVNNYVIDNLIDWHKVPDDPIFQLVFPQKGMLDDVSFKKNGEFAQTRP